VHCVCEAGMSVRVGGSGGSWSTGLNPFLCVESNWRLYTLEGLVLSE
jgi:hypothetical protein